MELFDTKINHFSGWNHYKQKFSFSTLESNESLSLPLKKLKNKEKKFKIKLEFLKIKGTNHLKAKKNGG